MFVRLVLLLYCLHTLKGQGVKHRNIDYSQCGKRYLKDEPMQLGSFTSETGKFPWHVGIYKYDKFLENYENVCGGTIISSHIVITAASCVYDVSNKTTFRPTFFKIAAGKLNYDWSTADSNAQEVNVDDIAIPETYVGDINSYSENIALINLAKDLYFNDLVLPICFNWKRNIQHNIPRRIVQTAGWGLKGDVRFSPVLKEAALQFINIVECRKKYSSIRYLRFINYDKICLLTPNGRRDHDTGGGLVYKVGDQYNLMGIISSNINNDFSPSTNVSKHLNWIRSTVENFEKKKRCLDGFHCLDGTCIEEKLVCDGTPHCTDGTDEVVEICPSVLNDNPRPKGSCLLPTQRGGVSYLKLGCRTNDCEVKGGQFVIPNERVLIKCGKGFAPKETEGQARYVCTAGAWFPEDPECIKLCGGLKKENLNFECTYKNENVPCDSFMRPGAIARYSCNPHYTINDPIAFSGITTCLHGGKWKEELPTCYPDCGVENQVNIAETTISHGQKSVYGKYPWHVGIFKMIGDSYFNICGGSLIHKHFVLTAAHCMFNQNSNEKFNKSDLVVACGKFKRDWYTHEQYQQSSRVRTIITPETYAGYYTRYEHDIALLDTETSFIFDDFVLPVCLDRTRPVRFPSNLLATIVGWGLTEEATYSEDLREVHLPVISTVDCRKKYKDFIQFITSDKFCAIYKNGSGTQEGDSGGGLTFVRSGRHYVHGIVSVKKVDVNLFSAFTNVTTHLDWIQRWLRASVD